MSDDRPTSPDDPEWVDEIVRRALERAGGNDQSTPTAAPAQPSTTQAAAPVQPPATPAAAPGEQVVASTPATPPANGPGAASAPAPRAAPPLEPQPPAQPIAPEPAIVPPVTDPVAERPYSNEPRLPQADDMVSSYSVSDPAQPDQIAGARTASLPAAATMAYPDDDSLEQARFDEAVGPGFDESEDDDPIGGRMRGFLEWGAVVVGALAVALLIKTFLMQAYFIPSGSMEPTLGIGDRVLVNKLSYSFGDIGRGDLVVFNRPENQPEGEDDLIKRVIALPGEVIEFRDGEVFITTVDNPEQQRLVEPYLTEGVSTTGLVDTELCASTNSSATSCEIPEGSVFVMGDNRPGSRDSRVFGPIPDDLVVGRAFLRVWPLGDIGFL